MSDLERINRRLVELEQRLARTPATDRHVLVARDLVRELRVVAARHARTLR